MKTELLPATSEGISSDFISFPKDGLSLTKIDVEEPSDMRYQPSALTEGQIPKPLTHYNLEIASQKGHDQLISYLKANSRSEDIPYVTTLDISDIQSINLDVLFKAFPDINTLFLYSNLNISMTQLASYPNLRELTFDQVSIYWDEGEKVQFINQSLGKNLSIYLAIFPYFFNHLSARSYQLLAYLFNVLILINILEFIYTNNKDTGPHNSISNRFLINMISSLALRLGLMMYWLFKAANESFEIIREKKNQ